MNDSSDIFKLESDLPGHAWDEEVSLKTANGGQLERSGSAKLAMKVLGYKDKATLYALIKSGHIIARKKRHTANANSPYEVDMMSVWRYMQAGKRAAQEG